MNIAQESLPLSGGSVPQPHEWTAAQVAATRLARGYAVLTYGLLVVVMVRAWWWREANWDLLGLLVLSGWAGSGHLFPTRPFPRRWWMTMLITAVLAGVIGGALAYFRGR